VNYRILVRGQAKRDLQRAARYYEKQLAGLGRDFVAEIDRLLEWIGENPLLCQTVHQEVRRAIAHRFPYGLFYKIEGEVIVVIAIVHLRRDPTSWQRRL
jgi:plasmid stabilization system protein ParE